MSELRDPISDIEQLITELEEFSLKTNWLLPNKIVIPEEDFWRITHKIRELLPSELQEAQSMLSKRDLILKNAQEEHRRILDSASQRLEDMTSEEQVVIEAKRQAELILAHAKLEAETLKRDALLYTAELLQDMEHQFHETISSIQKGRQFLEDEISEQVEENLSDVEDPEEEQVETSDVPES